MTYLPGAPSEPYDGDLPDREMGLRPETRARIEALIGHNADAVEALDAIDRFPLDSHQGISRRGMFTSKVVKQLTTPFTTLMAALRNQEFAEQEAVGAGCITSPNYHADMKVRQDNPGLYSTFIGLREMTKDGRDCRPHEALALLDAYPQNADSLPAAMHPTLNDHVHMYTLKTVFEKLAEIDEVRHELKEEGSILLSELGLSASACEGTFEGIEASLRN